MKYPLRALASQSVWQRSMLVVRWKRDNPTAAPIYLRQLDLPGIDTKFMEANTVVLRELFDLVCTNGASNPAEADFCLRYGFLREPPRIRFRLLDPSMTFSGLSNCPDVELDAESFAALRLDVSWAIIIENKTTYLAFSSVPQGIAIFGAGYGASALAPASWLRHIRVLYWGDIDTHGLAILSQVREFLPDVQSILMDEETLLAYSDSWISEPTQSGAAPGRLTPKEQTLLHALQQHDYGQSVRLEQEKIPIAFALAVLRNMPVAVKQSF